MAKAKRLAAVSAAVLLGAALPVALTPTQAAQAACPTETLYSLSSSSVRMPFKGVPTFKDGKGGTITVSRSYSGSVSFQVTAGAESEVGAIFAKAKVSVSASLTKTNSTTTTHTYSHKISKGKYGNVKYVSWGKKVTWKKSRVNPNCTTTVLGSGSINFPSTSEGWYYWETSS